MVVWALRTHFPHASSILEIGCGVGGMLARIHDALPSAKVAGTDIYTAALPYAEKRVPEASLLQMDATAIPFDAEFDVVAACDVLEHIERDELALAEMHRAVAPGGGIILTVPQDPRLWSVWDELSHHHRRYAREELVRKVRAAGFDVRRVLSLFSLLYPVTRIQRRRAGTAYTPSDELRLAAPLNFVLGGVMDFERMLLRAGIDFPWGGSLLLVAVRN